MFFFFWKYDIWKKLRVWQREGERNFNWKNSSDGKRKRKQNVSGRKKYPESIRCDIDRNAIHFSNSYRPEKQLFFNKCTEDNSNGFSVHTEALNAKLKLITLRYFSPEIDRNGSERTHRTCFGSKKKEKVFLSVSSKFFFPNKNFFPFFLHRNHSMES